MPPAHNSRAFQLEARAELRPVAQARGMSAAERRAAVR